MNRQEAICLLHDRHPHVIDAPGDRAIDLEALHLDVFWFQGHVCELMDERAERSLKRCFATIQRLLAEGDHEVRAAVCDHFAFPHLAFHSAFGWARQRMPPLLVELCSKVNEEDRGERSAPGRDNNADADANDISHRE